MRLDSDGDRLTASTKAIDLSGKNFWESFKAHVMLMAAGRTENKQTSRRASGGPSVDGPIGKKLGAEDFSAEEKRNMRDKYRAEIPNLSAARFDRAFGKLSPKGYIEVREWIDRERTKARGQSRESKTGDGVQKLKVAAQSTGPGFDVIAAVATEEGFTPQELHDLYQVLLAKFPGVTAEQFHMVFDKEDPADLQMAREIVELMRLNGWGAHEVLSNMEKEGRPWPRAGEGASTEAASEHAEGAPDDWFDDANVSEDSLD